LTRPGSRSRSTISSARATPSLPVFSTVTSRGGVGTSPPA
jgi:hypothetical protein